MPAGTRSLARVVNQTRSLVRFLMGAVQLAGALIAILATAAGAAILSAIAHWSLTWPFACLTLGLVIGSGTVFFSYLRESRGRSLLKGYRWVRASYAYTVKSAIDHEQAVAIEIEANRPRVSYFEGRFMWTGSGDSVFDINSPRHSVSHLYRSGGWTHYGVNLGRELGVGDRECIRVTHVLSDSHNTFEPIVAKVIIEPIDELMLTVVLPVAPKDVWRIMYSGPPPTGVPRLRELLEHHGERFEWRVRSPILNCRYELRWEP